MAYYDDWPVLGPAEVNPRQQRLFEQYEEYLLRYIKERYDDARALLESRLLRPGCIRAFGGA